MRGRGKGYQAIGHLTLSDLISVARHVLAKFKFSEVHDKSSHDYMCLCVACRSERRSTAGDPHDASSPALHGRKTTMSTLQQLQTACLGLLFSTQAHNVGFARLGVQQDVEALSERELYLLNLYDRLGEVCLERRVVEAELKGAKINGLSLVSFCPASLSFLLLPWFIAREILPRLLMCGLTQNML